MSKPSMISLNYRILDLYLFVFELINLYINKVLLDKYNSYYNGDSTNYYRAKRLSTLR